MAFKGRKPKPAGLSTRRPRPDPMSRPRRLPACPDHLDREAKREWKRIGHRLLDAGLFTDIDTTALAIYCQAWSRWVDTERALARYGTVVKSPSGFPIQSPYLAIANKTMEQMTKLLVEFGMSPSSRTRVSIAQDVPPRARNSVHDEPGDDPRSRLRSVK